jgi:hypothetical protein
MLKFSYPYTASVIAPSAAHPQGLKVYRPLLAATVISASGKAVSCITLVDSGADACLFPLALALDLKLDILSLPKAMTGGVGSSANITYYADVTIDLGDGIRFKAYAGFTQGMDASGLGLLGQNGFFQKFNVEFRNTDKTFTIEPAVPKD